MSRTDEAVKKINVLKEENNLFSTEIEKIREFYKEAKRPYKEAIQKLEAEENDKCEPSYKCIRENEHKIDDFKKEIIDELRVFNVGDEFRTRQGSVAVIENIYLIWDKESKPELRYVTNKSSLKEEVIKENLKSGEWRTASKNDFSYTSGIIFMHVQPIASPPERKNNFFYIGLTAKGNAVIFYTGNELKGLPNKDEPDCRKWKLVGKNHTKSLNKVSFPEERKMTKCERTVYEYVYIYRVIDHKNIEELTEFLL